ncbi:MAG: hypothetical protein HY059_09875 [Proteobacteria bacterium]|nr:hypothetical protein [Pseudomonadota bacterium]
MTLPRKSLLVLWVAVFAGGARAQQLASVECSPHLAQCPEPVLPKEAREIAAEFDKQAGEIRGKAEQKIDQLRTDAARRLAPLQARYTREAKLDEAVAIRDLARRVNGVIANPGRVYLTENDIGRTFRVEIVGETRGIVWGSDVYTTDSDLAPAAVHAGLLKTGEKGVITVSVLPGQDSYKGETRNDVSSQTWARWPVSMRLEKFKADAR